MNLLVPFHMADPAGIVFFGQAFTLFHQAFEKFVIDDLRLSWSYWFQNPTWIAPVRHAEADYLSPLFAGQKCSIALELIAVSSSSFTLAATFKQEERLCYKVKVVHAFCDRTTGKKCAIPPEILVKLDLLHS